MDNIHQVYDFLRHADYYMLATTDGNQPRVRPFGTINLFEGRLYIETLHTKRVARQLALNPLVEICAMSHEGDAWIRVAGTLVDDTRVEAKHAMMEAYPELRTIYDEHSDETAVYYFRDAVAWISREGQPDEEFRF